MLRVSRNTIHKVITGNINNLCVASKKDKLDKYLNQIVRHIQNGMTTKMIYLDLGSPGSCSNFYNYVKKVCARLGLSLTKGTHKPRAMKDGSVPGKSFDYLKRSQVMQYLWQDEPLPAQQLQFLLEKYPVVFELRKRIMEFRQIFNLKNPCMLRLFILGCMTSKQKLLVNFAKSLQRDFEAVDNAVSSAKSNAFVEGINNKIKMVKRVMYGRCRIELLKAKLIGKRIDEITVYCG